ADFGGKDQMLGHPNRFETELLGLNGDLRHAVGSEHEQGNTNLHCCAHRHSCSCRAPAKRHLTDAEPRFKSANSLILLPHPKTFDKRLREMVIALSDRSHE